MTSDKKLLRIVLFLVPLICGFVGFYILEREPLTNTLFYCVLMYALNYTYAPPNVLVEIARWTAPLISAYWIFALATSLKTRLRDHFRCRRADSVAVYGPEEECEQILAELGSRGVAGGSVPSAAKRHILLWDEESNFRFYERCKDRLSGKQVYIKSSSIPSQAVSCNELHLFRPEETAARLYWKKEALFEESRERGHHIKLVFIGFGELGSELLGYALQNNIFSPDQRIEYHVFGGDGSYLKIHHALSGLQDPIVFHEETWLDDLTLLASAARVIVLQQRGQTELLSQLLLTADIKRIDVFSSEDVGIGMIGSGERIIRFPWKELAYMPENIFGDELFRRAKAINLRYAHIYGGAPETAEAMDSEWKKLDGFTRYSNVSSADYHEIRLSMLGSMGIADPGCISQEQMELLAELEHMRWCRYHLLSNWSFGIPDSGARKDSAKKIHSDLKPYDLLSEEEKQKDRDTIRTLLELEGSQDI